MTTQAEKFANIAKAIRNVNGRVDKHKIVANDFVSEINQLDPRIILYPEDYEFWYGDDGYGGMVAVECAKSYYHARFFGRDKFTYSVTNAFSSPNEDGIRVLRDQECAQIDCSTYISLCLRGIDYENSPYVYFDENEQKLMPRYEWKPAEELPKLIKESRTRNGDWIFDNLDQQEATHRDGKTLKFTNLGIDGYSSIRTAAHIGEYFYKYGQVIYDSKRDGILKTAEELNYRFDLRPGDLVFWSNEKSTSTAALARFKSITHVGMISEDPRAYYHVTGTKNEYDQPVVKWSFFDNTKNIEEAQDDDSHTFEMLTLVCRPDYRPKKVQREVPENTDLLKFPWTVCSDYYKNTNSYKTIDTGYGISLKMKNEREILISGTATDDFIFWLKGNEDGEGCITLTKGTYNFNNWNEKKGLSLIIETADGEEISTTVGDSDSSRIFKLTKSTKIRVYVSIGSGVSFSTVGESFEVNLTKLS